LRGILVSTKFKREIFMQLQSIFVRGGLFLLGAVGLGVLTPSSGAQGLLSSDLSRLRSVGSVELSPDGRRIA